MNTYRAVITEVVTYEMTVKATSQFAAQEKALKRFEETEEEILPSAIEERSVAVERVSA